TMSHSRSTLRSEPTRPISIVASIWLVAIALTGYCASDLRSWAHASAALEDSQLVAITEDVQAFGDATSLADLRDRLRRTRERIYKDGERVAPAVALTSATPLAQPSPPGDAPPGDAPPSDAPAGDAPPPRAIRRALVIGASSIQFDLGIALEQQ